MFFSYKKNQRAKKIIREPWRRPTDRVGPNGSVTHAQWVKTKCFFTIKLVGAYLHRAFYRDAQVSAMPPKRKLPGKSHKKPFSHKQKKQQLLEKRHKKRERGRDGDHKLYVIYTRIFRLSLLDKIVKRLVV